MASAGGERSKSEFEVGTMLGDGSFCYVVKCTERTTGKQFAQKIVNLKTKGALEACQMEAHILRRLADSIYVPTLHYVFESSFEWTFVLDLYDGGELWTLVRRTGCVDAVEQVWYAAQMVEAVAALHHVGIVHRDLKCENFMVDSSSSKRVRLIDFGTARDTRHPEVKTMPPSEHHVGTPNFMAPEAINNKGNDFRSDLWSLGCCFYQLCIGSPPFYSPGAFFVLDRASRRDLWLPSGLVEDARTLVDALVKKEAGERLGASEGVETLLKHSYFTARTSVVPRPSAESRALSSIGQAIYAALGPIDDGMVTGMGMMMEKPVDGNAERKARADKAWPEALKAIEAIAASSPSDEAVVLLHRLAEEWWAAASDPGLTDNWPGTWPDAMPQLAGLSDFSRAELARFVEQANQLRIDFENPSMPEGADSDSDEEEQEENDDNEENDTNGALHELQSM